MKKTVLFALPLVALMLAVACKKQEAAQTETAPAATEQVAGTATEAAAPAAAPAATPAPAAAPAKPTEKKGK